jgi:hypothetical protein
MPTKRTTQRARKGERAGKSPSTQAGEFVREEIHNVRRGKHGARSAKQVIAIGLSKARRAGVDLPPPEKGSASEETRERAKRDQARGERRGGSRKKSAKRSRAATQALKREGRAAASTQALSRHAKSAARERSAAERSASAKKAARTKGAAGRSAAARKAARTRARAT